MPAKISPLQIEGYYVREFRFAVKTHLEEQEVQIAMQPGLHPQIDGLFNPESATVSMKSSVAVNHEDSTRWRAILEVHTEDEPDARYPYDFRAVLVGYFKLQTNQPVTDLEQVTEVVKITATSILYSAARELIAGGTGRGPFPAAIIPSLVLTPDIPLTQRQLPAKGKVGRKGTAKKTTKKGASKKGARKKAKG